jgi:hypothetical protein
MWHATVTPLASIIGSGFLICAPLLALVAGSWAPLVMLGITGVAYALGNNIRFNIQHTERYIDSAGCSSIIQRLEGLSRFCLGIAYIISVAFYLKLLSIFVLRGINIHSIFLENCFTTAIVLVIGISGKIKGLPLLELQEMYFVNFKLAIIIAFIFSLVVYNVSHLSNVAHFFMAHFGAKQSIAKSLKQILGTLLIVQGFETSRYLGSAYSPSVRIDSMRNAQIISSIVYVAFIVLSLPLMQNVHRIKETLIVQLSGHVALILPLLLTLAAIASQFSAAIADTIGSSGLLVESAKKYLSRRNSYLLIASFVIGLVWFGDVYHIIAIASKAFAIYYAIQLVISLIYIRRNPPFRVLYFIFYLLLLMLMLLVVVFGSPVVV